jgi:hypothetical protein
MTYNSFKGSKAKTEYYFDAMFVKECAANENGIVTDFHDLHVWENRWAVGESFFKLRDEIHESLGFEGESWLDVTQEQAKEEEAMYWSARYGEAQLRYDEIMERHRADWDKYY